VSRLLPPLNALRAFDATGRLLSFSKAAVELNVTQGAISRHVRELEERLGAKLFVRLTRRVELTEAGRAYLAQVQLALDQIERATREIRSRRERRILTISVLPSVASYWLMPRLARFSRSQPRIEIRILTSIQPVDLRGGEADLAIRVGPLPGERFGEERPRIELQMVKDWRGVRADYLFPDILLPFCAPVLANGRRALRQPRDLRDYPLIHTSTREHAWPDWLRAQGVSGAFARGGTYYGHFFMAIQAAGEGQGVAIVPHVLLCGREGEGFIFPFRRPTRSAGDYHLLMLESRRDDPEIELFRDWLLGQAHEQNQADAFFPMKKTHAS
jgi:LysR family glycine cleavage system transcriptional activator